MVIDGIFLPGGSWAASRTVSRLMLGISLVSVLGIRWSPPGSSGLFRFCLGGNDGLYVILNFAAALEAEGPSNQFPIAINIEILGQELHPAIGIADAFFSQQHWVIDAHLLREVRDVLGAGIVHGDADNLQALGTVLFL